MISAHMGAVPPSALFLAAAAAVAYPPDPLHWPRQSPMHIALGRDGQSLSAAQGITGTLNGCGSRLLRQRYSLALDDDIE